MKNKRGSHISFIISFILFISFLIFFIGIIKPFEKVETGKGALLKHLENEIIHETSEEVLVVSVIEMNGGSKKCSDIEGLIDNKKNMFSEKENGLIKIYISNEFASSEFLCNPQDKYEIGLVRSQKYVLSSKVLELNESYNNNYAVVKESFGIPETNDFEFSFLDIDKNSIMETKSKETPSTEVLAELIPINYLTENAEIKTGYFKVVLW